MKIFVFVFLSFLAVSALAEKRDMSQLNKDTAKRFKECKPYLGSFTGTITYRSGKTQTLDFQLGAASAYRQDEKGVVVISPLVLMGSSHLCLTDDCSKDSANAQYVQLVMSGYGQCNGSINVSATNPPFSLKLTKTKTGLEGTVIRVSPKIEDSFGTVSLTRTGNPFAILNK